MKLSELIESRLRGEANLIQVIIGPRQVGKTTAVQQALAALPTTTPRHYATADAWSELIKKLWDENRRKDVQLHVVLLGSSSLALKDDEFRWFSFLKNSIVETVIDKGILQLRKVERPALFKQVFELACGYPAQEISLRKLVGQLQDPGSVETVKHYLELLEGAFLIKTLQKYSTNLIQKKSSSPKILPMCPALCTFSRGEAQLSNEDRGRIFELVVGLDLMRLQGTLYYWRDGNDEVDFVCRIGKKVYAIEVKSGRKKSVNGLARFREEFQASCGIVITPDNYLDFATSPADFLFRFSS